MESELNLTSCASKLPLVHKAKRIVLVKIFNGHLPLSRCVYHGGHV